MRQFTIYSLQLMVKNLTVNYIIRNQEGGKIGRA